MIKAITSDGVEILLETARRCAKCGEVFLGEGIPRRRNFRDLCRVHKGEGPVSKTPFKVLQAFVAYEVELNNTVLS